MNDAQKQLLDSTQKGVFQFTQLVKNLEKSNEVKDSIVSVQSSDIDRLLSINNANVKAMVKKDKTIQVLKYISIGEAIALALFAIFR